MGGNKCCKKRHTHGKGYKRSIVVTFELGTFEICDFTRWLYDNSVLIYGGSSGVTALAGLLWLTTIKFSDKLISAANKATDIDVDLTYVCGNSIIALYSSVIHDCELALKLAQSLTGVDKGDVENNIAIFVNAMLRNENQAVENIISLMKQYNEKF